MTPSSSLCVRCPASPGTGTLAVCRARSLRPQGEVRVSRPVVPGGGQGPALRACMHYTSSRQPCKTGPVILPRPGEGTKTCRGMPWPAQAHTAAPAPGAGPQALWLPNTRQTSAPPPPGSRFSGQGEALGSSDPSPPVSEWPPLVSRHASLQCGRPSTSPSVQKQTPARSGRTLGPGLPWI